MEKLNRLVISYEYYRHQDKLNKSGNDNSVRQNKLNQLTNDADRLQKEMKLLEKDKEEATERWKSKSAEGGAVKDLEHLVRDYSTQLVRLKTKYDLQKKSVLEEESNFSNLSSSETEVIIHIYIQMENNNNNKRIKKKNQL